MASFNTLVTVGKKKRLHWAQDGYKGTDNLQDWMSTKPRSSSHANTKLFQMMLLVNLEPWRQTWWPGETFGDKDAHLGSVAWSFAKPRQLLGPAITSISPTSLSMQIPGNTNRFLQWGGFVPILHGCFFLPDNSVSKYLPLHAFFFTPDCRSRHWVGDTVSSWLSLEVSDFYPICNVLRTQISNIIVRSFNKRKIEVFFLLEADTKHISMRYNGHIFDYVNNYHLKQMWWAVVVHSIKSRKNFWYKNILGSPQNYQGSWRNSQRDADHPSCRKQGCVTRRAPQL